MTRSVTRVEPDSLVNPSVWFNIFHESKLLACLIEVLKNGFDWDALVVRLVTDEAHDQLRHVDDGRGMDAANRRAFLSVGYSTAGGDQSGTFGTGAKKIIFTFARKVRVVTAPQDEPSWVYMVEFTPEQLAQDYSSRGEPQITWRRQRKSSRTWVHEHPFGTDVVYWLRDPDSKSIRRGATLAKMLSQRLDLVLIEGGMVQVNGSRLPAKELEGSVYSLDLPADSPLGAGRLEFYRPRHRSGTEDLRMTGRAIGEVSLRDLWKLLPDDLQAMVPPLFLEADVCGLIAAEFLNEHVTERRDAFGARILDDERLKELFRLLRDVEPAVAKKLGIKLRQNGDPEAASRDEVEAFVTSLQSTFNPTNALPQGYVPTGKQADDNTGQTQRRQPGRTVPVPPVAVPFLVINRPEYELGEEIVVRLVVPKGFDGSAEDFHFYLDQAHARSVSVGVGEAHLIADHVGRGLIQAINPLKGTRAKEIVYEVVSKRVFHLSVRGTVGVQVGGQAVVTAFNPDKLTGPIEWRLEGPGELRLTNGGLTAHVRVTQGGRTRLVAYDSANPDVGDSCEILGIPGDAPTPPIMIRGRFFEIDIRANTLRSFNKPATIMVVPATQRDPVHRLVFNPLAAGFQAALKKGTLQQMLAYAVALEFIIKFWDPEDLGSPEDQGSVLVDIQNEADKLYAEMMGETAR